MTAYKPRDVLSRHDAILTAVDGVGARALAARVDRSISLVQQWTNPDSGKEPSLTQALALDLAYVERHGGVGPIHEWYGLQLTQAAPSVKGPETRLVEATAEFGDVARGLAEALKDGRLSPAEAARIGREIKQALDALRGLQGDIAAASKVRR